ncbi:zinc metalloprotease [Rubripirellula lacrimiformis]|uniref:hypothetical protein n=1 Tax=Rubripirellula lacrimiformis TaxID=1930273 RepID=UPI001C54CDD8|nr:hypothetical protein [Rubripirellula lacrimiformis]
MLRHDLTSMVVDGSHRGVRIVVDEISGRFTRVSNDLWQSLCSGTATEDEWQQARQVGWTRHRSEAKSTKFSPLYVRLTIGSIDTVAQHLAGVTGWLFGRRAVMFWATTILFAFALVISHRQQWMASFDSLGNFFAQANPIVLGGFFVATKVIHELAHAVMCRRVGSRCGSVGVLLLCGMPCPFCDVSDTARQPSAWRRASVMLAGIYVELIIASIATFVWLAARDPSVAWYAFNLMFVCGISTLVFNANPLMRYDGYFVLSDWIGSVNLRSEARSAFRAWVVAPIAGPGYRIRFSGGVRTGCLALYHAASTLYRLVVLVAIASMGLALADRIHLRSAMIALLAVAATMMLFRTARTWAAAIIGRGDWGGVSSVRRGGILIGGAALSLMLVGMPLPRYRSAIGHVDAVEAVQVFLPVDSIVADVNCGLGDHVHSGTTLALLSDDRMKIDLASLRGKIREAEAISWISRRFEISNGAGSGGSRSGVADAEVVHWNKKLASIQIRADKNDVRAPVSGMVLPAEPTLPNDSLRGTMMLADYVGTLSTSSKAWCRISPDGQLHAVLQVDARDRNHIRLRSAVRMTIAARPDEVIDSWIESVSSIDSDAGSTVRRGGFEVLCPLPMVDSDQVMAMLGSQCRAVVRLPNQSLAGDAWQKWKGWNGE